jgi:hypothetical protein
MLPPVTVFKRAMAGAKRKSRKNSRASALAQDKLSTSRIFLQPPSLRGMKAGSEKVENAVNQLGTKINAVISPRSPVAVPSSVAWLNHDAAAKAGIYGNDAVEAMYPP